MRGHRDLRAVLALALLCALLAPLLVPRELSLLFALPLALFLPGYAMTLAIFARRPIERPQRLLLGLGLSLCVLALGALPLNYVPGGIGPVSWAALLLLVVLASCRAAAVRRPRATPRGGTRAPTGGRAGVKRLVPLIGERDVSPTPSSGGVSAVNAGFLCGAAACLVAALALTFTTTSAEHADGYTALWLLPPAAANAAAGGARVGVSSEEQERTAYRLRVQVGDRPGEVVRAFSLEPGQTRVLKLTPESPSPGAAVPVRATLFLRGEEPDDVYRRVSGWLAQPQRSR